MQGLSTHSPPRRDYNWDLFTLELSGRRLLRRPSRLLDQGGTRGDPCLLPICDWLVSVWGAAKFLNDGQLPKEAYCVDSKFKLTTPPQDGDTRSPEERVRSACQELASRIEHQREPNPPGH